MATVNINLSQAVADQLAANNAADTTGPDTLASLFDSLFKIDSQLAQAYSYAPTWTSSTSNVVLSWPSIGATKTYTGTSTPTYTSATYSYGNAVANSVVLNIPGQIKETATGNFYYGYTISGGNLSFNLNATSTLSAYSIETLSSADPLFGKEQIGLTGTLALSTNQNFSGSVSSFTVSAEKFLRSAVISGNFNLSGNISQIASGSTSTVVTGNITGYSEQYYDGSLISVSGAATSVTSGTVLDFDFLNGGMLAGNDVINVQLPSSYYEDVRILAGSGDDQITLSGGGGRLTIDAGAGNDTITGGASNDIFSGGEGSDTAVFSGAKASYVFTGTASNLVVRDTRASGGNGVDTLLNMEFAQFADGTYAVASLLPPSFALSSNASSINEGGTVTFTLVTTNVTNGTALTYSLGGTGITAVDVVGGSLSGVATVNNNQATFTVSLVSDLTTEGSETLTVSVQGQTTLVQVNDTSTTPPTYTLSANTSYVNEGSAVTFTVATTNVTNGTGLTYSLGGSGITASDVVGGSLNGTAIVNNNQATFTVNLASDLTTEGSETLTATVQGQSTSVTLNDTSTTPILTVSAPLSVVSENGSNNLIYTFSRTGEVSSSLSLNIVMAGNSSGSDYSYSGSANLSQITFAPGSATATLVIDPTPDATVEGNESVIVTIASGTGYVVGSSASATGWIDDVAPTAVSFGPVDNASAVSPSANLLLTFSEPVAARSGQVGITDTSTGLATTILAGDTSQVSINGSVMTINPTAALKPLTHYAVTWNAGVVSDIGGNEISGMSNVGSWDFTTGAGVNLAGKAYHWSSHVLLADTAISAQVGTASPFTGSSDANGDWQMDAIDPGNYALSATRAATDASSTNAITSADALAALRLAVGLNPNTGSAVVSPYQFMAADVVGTDGKVTAADALAILRMAVKLPSAPANEWMFVEDSRDFWDETTNTFTIDRNHASWDKSIVVNANADKNVNLVGILKGDVNGSWAAPAGTPDLDNINTHYFTDLQTQHHVPLAQMGVLV